MEKLVKMLGGDEEKLRFAFKIYDMNEDGFITNGELFTVGFDSYIGNLTVFRLGFKDDGWK